MYDYMSEQFGGANFRMNILSHNKEIGTLEDWWQSDADSWTKRALAATWFNRVYSKCKTITQCFHENGHWLGVENSIYFESSFISDLMERHPKALMRARVPGPPSI